MNSPPQTECMISGTLSFVLRMSRIVGVAPLRFRKTREGWYVRVSPAANCYGQFIGFILCIMAAVAISLDISVEPERSFRTHTSSTRVVWVADLGVVGLVVCAAAVTGLSRMKSLIVYLLQLQKINFKLNLYQQDASKERKMMLLVVSLMLLSIFTVLLDYGIFIYQVVTEEGKVVTSCMYIFYNISSIVLEIVLIQFSQIATNVLTSFQTLNKRLKSLLQEILSETSDRNNVIHKESNMSLYNCIAFKSVNSVIDSMAVYGGTLKTSSNIITTLRRLAVLYCSLCDVVRQVNDNHGAVLVSLLLSLLLHLVITPYHVITNIFNSSMSDRSSPLLQLNWAVLHFSNLMMIIEPCHRTHEEIDVTKSLISQMTRHTPPEHDALLFELEMFYRHVTLNEVTYAPLKMFALNRTLIVAILGSITTYLVVIIQL